MNVEIGVPLAERGHALLRWRKTLGWGLAETASRLGITTRTLSSHESEAQPVPDARWRLFVHEITEALRSGNSYSSLVVVVAEDGLTCLDVVSAENFAGVVFSDDGKQGIIASYALNRQTGAPYLHRQLFLVAVNKHVVQVSEAWERARRAEADGETVAEVHRWITRLALKGEIDRPEMAVLKAEVGATNDRLQAASNESSETQAALFDAHEKAVATFVKALAVSQAS